ncbi:uncharacterized protein LOC118605420 [Rousettus aegyptiacus]|uniref:uncharacterized protein LOC118605420 n=1 Tax=Rousettus aegyptiacus TaxID=9407 RepID=UPI00168D5044|nr:uncharacterized protein LOC118605420 [Rousettus aegyptiacus]XP_036080803.1 uncharacterized protein LOC118605420 [Rousettus aegyptiacus]XP_036080804.1 uncharacterized protein LOC118605420 [Rousettus aegyptiacus]
MLGPCPACHRDSGARRSSRSPPPPKSEDISVVLPCPTGAGGDVGHTRLALGRGWNGQEVGRCEAGVSGVLRSALRRPWPIWQRQRRPLVAPPTSRALGGGPGRRARPCHRCPPPRSSASPQARRLPQSAARARGASPARGTLAGAGAAQRLVWGRAQAAQRDAPSAPRLCVLRPFPCMASASCSQNSRWDRTWRWNLVRRSSGLDSRVPTSQVTGPLVAHDPRTRSALPPPVLRRPPPSFSVGSVPSTHPLFPPHFSLELLTSQFLQTRRSPARSVPHAEMSVAPTVPSLQRLLLAFVVMHVKRNSPEHGALSPEAGVGRAFGKWLLGHRTADQAWAGGWGDGSLRGGMGGALTD